MIGWEKEGRVWKDRIYDSTRTWRCQCLNLTRSKSSEVNEKVRVFHCLLSYSISRRVKKREIMRSRGSVVEREGEGIESS